jgi:hypothetical protein
MRNPADSSENAIYRTFEEFEREEIRRADSLGGTVDSLFDDMFTDELDLDASGARLGAVDYGDDEE